MYITHIESLHFFEAALPPCFSKAPGVIDIPESQQISSGTTFIVKLG
jgi:hypothetical protein